MSEVRDENRAVSLASPLARRVACPVPDMRRVRRIHLIGIGGSGMCGIAEVLFQRGYEVSGSDAQASSVTRRLAFLGIRVFDGHAASYVQGADLVVVSTAIGDDNPELCHAHSCGIAVVPRAQMLAEIMRQGRSIVVAGTHGKTTTTSLLAAVLRQGDLDPTCIVGGRASVSGSHAQAGSSRYFVAEADESDASFLCLQPSLAIVTNIDVDHMATYSGSFAFLQEAFVDFLHKLPPDGLAVLCIDDPVIRQLLPRINRRVITYGLSADADYRATHIGQQGATGHFVLERQGLAPVPVSLALPGEHNVLNALAVFATAAQEAVADETIGAALEGFEGVDRRFQLHQLPRPGGGEVLVVDDYGHHPREVAAAVDTVRKGWPDRRLVMVYQPHRYSRTRDLFTDFVEVLSDVDVLVLVDVYPAGEEKIEGAGSDNLCKAIDSRGKMRPVLAPSLAVAAQWLDDLLVQDDVLMVQGAGDVDCLIPMLKERGGKSGAPTEKGRQSMSGSRDMNRKKKKIADLGLVAILCGGHSRESHISLESGARTFEAFKALGMNVVLVDISEDLPGQLKRIKPARAFLALHGGEGEDGTVQALLNFLRIPYTGSGVAASALAMDKYRSKLIWNSLGLATPAFCTADAGTDLERLEFPLPAFVKPNAEGSSLFAFPVRTKEELKAAVPRVLEHARTAIIETMVEGREFVVGILNDKPLPAIHLEFDQPFFDYEAKYLSDQTRYNIPSGLSAEKEAEIQQLAFDAFAALGCRSWGRVDLMQDRQGKFWLLEVNTLPGLTTHSLVPMAAGALGYEFDDLLLELLWHTEREEWPWMPVGTSGTIAGDD